MLLQRYDHFHVGSMTKVSNLTSLPPTNSPHGAYFYRKTFEPNSWWWG